MQNFKLNIKELFAHSEELLLIVNEDKNISHLNPKATILLGARASFQEIEHLFSFDVGVLDREKILDYSALKQAINSKEPFYCEILLQLERDQYKKFNLRSFKNNTDTIILLSDISGPETEKKLAELEKQNSEFLALRERAQNLAIRTSLINRISNSIRESLNIDEIIKTITTEVINTLGLGNGKFVPINEVKEEHKPIQQTISGRKLIMPVIYRDEILGVLELYHNNKKAWNEEEISLIEGIASQLSTAINQSRQQTQLIQSEKMASLGQLVAGVAHEINTPLGSINSNNALFKKCVEKLSGPEDINSMINELININTEAIKRINELAKSLKNFARLDEAEFQEADIHEGIKNTLMLINHEIKDRIEVIKDFGEIPNIKCYPNQLNQVFMNILINAAQSIEGEGKITITTGHSAPNIVITISDTGSGIPKENLKKIFDPGFTTKSVGVGTGLGLSIVYRIIQKHNGKISVESQVGRGTTFRIELPAG